MNKKETIRFIILQSIGNFLLLFAIFGVISTFGPAAYFELQYRLIQIKGVQYKVASENTPSGFGEIIKKEQEKNNNDVVSNEPTFGSILSGPQQQILIPKDTQFSIIIPKIGASAKIFANVDASNEQEFLPVLQKGIAHAKGSVFPGMKGNIYLFAHSTDNFWDVGRYNAIFYLLQNLSAGDEVIIFFENVRHEYVVTGSKIVDPENVSYLTNSQKTNQETLVMQTCWPPGTTWKRLLVFAQPK